MPYNGFEIVVEVVKVHEEAFREWQQRSRLCIRSINIASIGVARVPIVAVRVCIEVVKVCRGRESV